MSSTDWPKEDFDPSQALALDQLIMPQQVRQDLSRFLRNHAHAAALLDEWMPDARVPQCGVVLISGPLGVGKSALARAIIREAVQLAQAAGREIAFALTSASRLKSQTSFAPALSLPRDGVVVIDDAESMNGDAFLTWLKGLGNFRGVVVVVGRELAALDPRILAEVQLSIALPVPDTTAREHLWELHLPLGVPVDSDVDVAELARILPLTGAQIRTTVALAAHEAIDRAGENPPVIGMMDLRAGVEMQRRHLELLGGVSVPRVGRDRPILDGQTAALFDEVLAGCERRLLETEEDAMPLYVLFDGPAGTGKTLLARVLAAQCRRPLVSVSFGELSAMGIGEAKTAILQRVRRARELQAILLFDDVDPLFSGSGSRSEGLGQLLIATLDALPLVCLFTASNFGSSEHPLKRRLDFRLSLPFPDADLRAKVWAAYLPEHTNGQPPISVERLGKNFELTPGSVKKAIRRARYRAASESGILSMALLSEAAVHECQNCGTLFRLEGNARGALDTSKVIKITPVANIDASILKAPDQS